jgi:hypothetical protein
VLVEDVGWGDLNLIAYSTMTVMKGIRDKVEENMLFAAMIQHACSAPKTRGCCELELGANLRSGWEGTAEHGWAKEAEDPEITDDDQLRHEMLVDSGGPLKDVAMAYISARTLRKRLRGQGHDALIPTLAFINETIANSWSVPGFDMEFASRAAMLSFERAQDTMHLALFPLMQWQGGDVHVSVPNEEKQWPPSIMVGPVASEAFDMHTLHGKKAIRAWWKSMKEAGYSWCEQIPYDDAIKAMGSLVFILEGGMLDRRLWSPGLAELKAYQDRNFAKGWGIPAELVDSNFDQLLADAKKEIPRLNDCRLWAWNT